MDAAAAEALIGLTGGGAGGGALQQQFSQQQQHYAGMMQHAGSEQLTTPMSATVRACVCALVFATCTVKHGHLLLVPCLKSLYYAS
jgi:hypothetical protein